ncbi:hypothetical protein PVAP13_1KG291905, partial [Panicum virgatum]
QVTYFFFLQVPLSTNYFSASLTGRLRKRKEKACIWSPRTNLGGNTILEQRISLPNHTAAAADPPSPKDSTHHQARFLPPSCRRAAGGALPAAEQRAVACCCRAAREFFLCPGCRRPGRRQADLAAVIRTATGLMQVY